MVSQELEEGTLLTIVEPLRVFPRNEQTHTLVLEKGEVCLILYKRWSKARGATTKGNRNLWYVMLSPTYGLVESGPLAIHGFYSRILPHVVS